MANTWYFDYNSANTTANGSYQYPWSPASSNRISGAFGLNNGDELRILGNTIANICNSTIYYVNILNGSQMNVTSGGNLSADFSAYNLLYFPSFDTFAKLSSVASGNLYIYSSHSWPVPNTAITNTTVQIVNSAINQQAATIYILGSTPSNVYISDAWVSPTTRVTDGTVKSILHCGTTGQPSFYVENQSSGCTNNTFNLQNSIWVGHTNNSFPFTYFYFNGSSSTYNIHSIIGSYYMLNAIGTQSVPIKNSYFNINHMTTPGTLFNGTVYGSNLTFNIANTYTQSTGSGGGQWPIGSSLNFSVTENSSLIFGNVYANLTSTSFISSYLPGTNTNIALNGSLEYRQNVGSLYEFLDGIGNTNISFGPSFNIKCNNKTRTLNTFTYFVGYGLNSAQNGKQILPTLNMPAGYVASYNGYSYTTSFSLTSGWPIWTHPKVPPVFNLEVPASPTFNFTGLYAATGQNLLLTYRDGSLPTELLWPQGMGYLLGITQSGVPNVTLDATTYRTTGPSLKSYLATVSNNYMDTTLRQSRGRKTIKIPVTGGQANTVTGYIRTDSPVTSYVSGDVQMYIILNNTILGSNTITSQCANAWSQFTMTFTPPYTGEATLVWEMYHPITGKSYWLDDLSIS